MAARCSLSTCCRAAGWALVLLLAACDDGGAPPPVVVDAGGDPIRLTTAAASAEIARAPFRLTLIREPGGEMLARQQAGGLYYERRGNLAEVRAITAVTPLDDGVELTVQTTEQRPARVTVRFLTPRTLEVELVPDRGTELTAIGDRWESPADEAIYGLTERLRDSPPIAPGVIEVPRDELTPVEVGSLNRRGETVEMYVRPTYGLYAPFYHSSRGYGLAVAGTMAGAFDVAHSDPTAVRFQFEIGNRSESQRLVYHLFAGPEHAAILDEYTALTGRPFVPPAWAFRHWRWRDVLAAGEPGELDGVAVNAQVAEDVAMFEALGIPPGVYLFDRPAFPGNFGFARFEWDETRLPNAPAMLDALRRRGYRVAVWSAAWACGSMPGDNGIAAQQLGFLAPGPAVPPNCADAGGGSFILDVTQAAAREWFGERLAAFLAAHEIDAIKLDRGEEHIPSAATDIWGDGRTGREVRNDYPLLQKAMHRDALAAARPAGEFVVIARAGYTGSARHGVVWGGDIPGSEQLGNGPGTDLGLRSAIISQQRAAFMGFPIWGSDVGGYYQFKDREVFARWIELGAFSGIMEIGGTGSHAPWDMPTAPRVDEELIDIYRRYTQLREALLPYITAAAADAARGLPLVRPMVFLDRTDPELRDRWDQYLFGPDLMIAPVWRVGERRRDVYFPRGSWRSFWDESERYEGPATVTVDAPLDVILVFIRGAAPRPGGAG